MNVQITVEDVAKVDFTTITEPQMDELAARIKSVTDKELYGKLVLAIIDDKYTYLTDENEKELIRISPNDSAILANKNIKKFFEKNEDMIQYLDSTIPKFND